MPLRTGRARAVAAAFAAAALLAGCRGAAPPAPGGGAAGDGLRSAAVGADSVLPPVRGRAAPGGPGRLAIAPRREMTVPGNEDTVRVVAVEVPRDLVWQSSDLGVASVRPLDPVRAVVAGRREGRAVVSVFSRSDPGLRAELPLWVGPSAPYPPIPPAQVAREGIRLEARAAAETGGPGVRPGTSRTRVEVVLTNTTGASRTLRLGACPLGVTAHGGGSHWGQEVHVQPPVWDERRLGGPCADAARAVTLPPGGSHTLRTVLAGDRVLGDSLEDSRYHLHARVALERDTVVLHAGSPEFRFGVKRFAVRIETGLAGGRGGAPDTLRARAVLRSLDDRPVRIEYGACALHLRAYRAPGPPGGPVWLSERRSPWEGTYGYGCPMYLASARVAPGEEFSPREFQLAVPLVEVLGDSLPDGRYSFTGALRVDGDTLHAAAGEALLRLERPPLPSSSTFRSITFEAATEAVRERPTLLRTRVTARLTHASGVLTKISEACPVVLLAYRSRERRDAAPRSGEPDARFPRTCGPARREVAFRAPDPRAGARPGEPFPAQRPGAPVVFEVESAAAELLGDALPPGRYYFAAAVPLEGRTLHLSAGEADLRR